MDWPKIPMPGAFRPKDVLFENDDVSIPFNITEYISAVQHLFNQIDEAILLKFLTDKGYSISHENPDYMEHIMSKLEPKEGDDESTISYRL